MTFPTCIHASRSQYYRLFAFHYISIYFRIITERGQWMVEKRLIKTQPRNSIHRLRFYAFFKTSGVQKRIYLKKCTYVHTTRTKKQIMCTVLMFHGTSQTDHVEYIQFALSLNTLILNLSLVVLTQKGTINLNPFK